MSSEDMFRVPNHIYDAAWADFVRDMADTYGRRDPQCFSCAKPSTWHSKASVTAVSGRPNPKTKDPYQEVSAVRRPAVPSRRTASTT